jgi:hypothetical protein
MKSWAGKPSKTITSSSSAFPLSQATTSLRVTIGKPWFLRGGGVSGRRDAFPSLSW